MQRHGRGQRVVAAQRGAARRGAAVHCALRLLVWGRNIG